MVLQPRDRPWRRPRVPDCRFGRRLRAERDTTYSDVGWETASDHASKGRSWMPSRGRAWRMTCAGRLVAGCQADTAGVLLETRTVTSREPVIALALSEFEALRAHTRRNQLKVHDLSKRIVEEGLHIPSAAERSRCGDPRRQGQGCLELPCPFPAMAPPWRRPGDATECRDARGVRALGGSPRRGACLGWPRRGAGCSRPAGGPTETPSGPRGPSSVR